MIEMNEMVLQTTPIYPREQYLSKIRPFYSEIDLIKVLSGIRRCRKSSLLMSVMQELREAGTEEESLVSLNLDTRENRHITTPETLDDALDARISNRRQLTYVFIDEIQNVQGFEPVLNSWREQGNVSIFVTGSNLYLLSGELVTKLTGRYVEFPMFPLNFQEYLKMTEFLRGSTPDVSLAFEKYIRQGGFPKTLELSAETAQEKYVHDVIEQILLKDVRGRQKIRNREGFEKMMTYVINNFGALMSVSSIAEAL